MAKQKVSIRYLIDIAIGNPEPGIVNFNALYTVLQAISEKLDIQDERIEIDSSFCPVKANIFDSKSNVSSERFLDHHDLRCETDVDGICATKPKEPTKDATETDYKETSHRCASVEQQHQADDRKVVFEAIQDDILSTTSSARRTTETERQAKTTETTHFRQHVNVINARLEKIENLLVSSADVDQNVECLRQNVFHLQDKLDALEQSVDELKDIRQIQEQDISACRKKLEHDKLATVTDGLKHELAELREAINKTNPIQLRSAVPATGEIIEIKADYTQLLSQLIEVKSDLCRLKEQCAKMEQDFAHSRPSSSVVTQNTFEQEISSLRELIESADANLTSLQTECGSQKTSLDELTSKFAELTATKIDKEEVDELLSEKADYTMLHRKVSVEHMNADHRKLEKQISEITNCLLLNDDRVQKEIGDIRKFLGDQSLEDLLYDFKVKIDKEIQVVRDAVKKLADMKPDVDAAVTRIRNLTCLSCDQDVVMKAFELNNLSKFDDAYVSKSISPLIAFEVGKLREAGKVGPTVDMNEALCNMGRNFRDCGGMHTIVTNEDRVSKIRRK